MIVEQKSAKWIEEDNRMLENLLWHLRRSVNNGDVSHTAEQLETWFINQLLEANKTELNN